MLRRPLTVAVTAAALVAVAVPAAYAAWDATGTGTGTASAQSLAAPGTPTAGTTTQTTAPISWTAAAAMPSGTISYWVQRAPFGSSTWSNACSSSEAAPQTALSCTDSGLTAGTEYQYRVTSVYQAWRAISGTSVKVTTAADTTPVISISAPTAGATNVKRVTTFSGSTTLPASGAVTVRVYTGTNTSVAPLRTLVDTPASDGAWSASLSANNGGSGRLAANQQYTMVVSQTGATNVTRTFTTGAGD